MSGRSGSSWLGVRAVALTVAYALVLQLLLASVFAARAAADPLGSHGAFICLNGSSSTAPSDEGGERRAVAHCPLCTLRVDLALQPVFGIEQAAQRFVSPIEWPMSAPWRRPILPARGAHHPRGPPLALSLV
ncbi:DUF2946 family protein [Ancylobacter vacuolatus]|uniref:DUF2946 domain-containing protein n=1 Tax=Ancylobacter vacuolatus TaxID=223389 RepID=A0ABU0DDT2_9HYPH|nr:hypothetical protein [Ancylobacter vacuolatus]MDQ0346581.1 hypothetical protein [Ancylobacter vacuolatus]